jgi:hypothetical protein
MITNQAGRIDNPEIQELQDGVVTYPKLNSDLVATDAETIAGTVPDKITTVTGVKAALDNAVFSANIPAITSAVGAVNRFSQDDSLPGTGAATTYGFSPQTGTTSSSGNVRVIFYNHPILVRSTLATVFFRSPGSGTIKIQVRRIDGKNVTLVSQSADIAIASGDNNLTPTDWVTPITLNPGDFISVYATQPYVIYSGNASDLQIYIYNVNGNTPTNTLVSDYIVAGQTEGFAWSAVPLAPRNSGVVSGLKTQLYNETFGSSAPAAWTFVTSGGPWTFSGGIITPNGAGDMTQRATMGNYLCGEQMTLEWVIQPQSVSAIIGFGVENNCLCLIDGVASTITMRNGGANTASLPAAYQTATIPSLISGRTYIVRLVRDRRINTFSIYDPIANVTTSVVEDKGNVSGTDYTLVSGAMDGLPYILNRAQSTKILTLRVFWDLNRPLAWIVGDSITAGFSVTIPSRWSQMVKDALGGSALIWGVGGAASPLGTTAFLGDFVSARPKVLIYAFGTNDTDSNLAQYKFNFWIVKRWCEIYGVIFAPVVLGNTPSKTFTNMNAFILAQAALFPNIRPIRWDYAITLNHDGTTYVPGNYIDQIHPTQAAQPLLVYPVFDAVPELLE